MSKAKRGNSKGQSKRWKEPPHHLKGLGEFLVKRTERIGEDRLIKGIPGSLNPNLKAGLIGDIDELGKIIMENKAMHKVYPPDREKIVQAIIDKRVEEQEKIDREKNVHIIENLDDMRDAEDKKYQETLNTVKSLAPLAKRFVFDKEASTHLGHFIRDQSDLLLSARQFAIPPYETTYIQVHIDSVIHAIGHGSTADRPGWDGSRDIETAYLINKQMVYPLARGNQAAGGLSLFSYEMLDHYKEEDRYCRCKPLFFGEPMYEDDKYDHVLRAMLLLGSTYNGTMKEKWEPFLHSVCVHLNVNEDVYKRFSSTEKEQWRKRNWQMIISSAGDYRVMLAALLLLNQQRHVETISVPNNSMIIGGKRKVVKSHHRVVIRLENFDVIKRSLGHVLLTPRVEHDVRGHLRNVHVLKGCEHEWRDLSDLRGIRRWTCVRCNGLRTTVRPHKRGDPTVGKATSNYEVKE